MNLLSSLRYLVALHEHRHFGRAAQACHITQPALSNALRALEDEFGATIVKRGRTFAEFTPEGERILASAHRMLHEHALLQQDINSAAGNPKGVLTIGSVPTAVPIAARFSAVLQARHPGITTVLRSMSSQEIELGLGNLSIDMAVGYTDRVGQRTGKFRVIDQYNEHYFLLRRVERQAAGGLQIGAEISWLEVSRLPLCLLTPEMHNRCIIDCAFKEAGVVVKPTIQTNSIMTLGLSVVAGAVCSILPGALVSVMRGFHELEALPLVYPEVVTPIGFMILNTDRLSRTLELALELAADPVWRKQANEHSGLLAL